MSERDDDYLWSGEGPASDEVAQLEKLLGGEKLRDPLRARPRRPLILAATLAVVAAAAAFAVIRDAWPSPDWTAAVLPGVSADDIQGAVFEFQLEGDAPPAGWQAAVEGRIREITTPQSVRFKGQRVVVDVARGVPDLGDALGHRREFAIKEVVESSPLMRELCVRVDEGDPLAAKLGVFEDVDTWENPSGIPISDCYLYADSRAALETFLRTVGAENPRLVPDSAHEFAFEQMQPRRDDTGPPRWRSYYLDRVAWISNADIGNAFVYWNRDTSRPEVLVEYTREAAERFADLTGRLIGRKIAIMLDGQVSSAPVVQARIEGGRTSITMGGSDPHKVQQEAQDLAGVLLASQHPMPVALELVDLRIRSEQLSETQLRTARGLMAALFGLLVFAAVFAVERRTPALDPEVAPVRGRPRRRLLWIRLAVSAAGAALALLANRVPIPGDIDWQAGYTAPISMFALGIMPALSAFLLVELAALIVPRWRSLRRGGPAARARLGSGTAVLTVLLAAVQAWFIADFLLAYPAFEHLSRAMLVASLTAGAVVMTFLALVISRYGLGNGFAVLLLAGHGALAHRVFHALAGGTAAPELILPFLLAVAATAIATSWLLRQRVRGPSPASSVRLPTAGLVPLAVVPSLLALFALTWPEGAARIGMWWQEGVASPGAGVLVELGFLMAAGALLSWLFSRPSRLGSATASGARSHGFAIAVALSLAYLAVLALLGRWRADVLGYFGLSLVSVAFATAILMDLVAEWRAFARRDDLIPIWPLHQVQRVDLVIAALGKNDIDVHTRGLYLRLLLHFFGPFVPVLIYVPAEQAEEARAIIRAQIEPR